MAERRERDAVHAFEGDLQALRRVTDRDLPSVGDTAQLLEARAASRAPQPIEEASWMKSRRVLSTRPWLTAAAATAVVAGILGIVPVSYERTTGHDVALTLAGPAPAAQALDRIATEFRDALKAGDVQVRIAASSPEPATMIEAVSNSRSRGEVERAASAFTAVLGEKGYRAQVRVTPRTQRLSSNVYAMAMNRAIELRIERAGRTIAEIEADIRAQLEAAGLENPEVQVTEEGGMTQIQIRSGSSSPDERREFKVDLKAGGKEPLEPRLHRFEVERKPGMTDADVKAEIERQMREAGVEGEVTVENGEIRINVRKEQ